MDIRPASDLSSYIINWYPIDILHPIPNHGIYINEDLVGAFFWKGSQVCSCYFRPESNDSDLSMAIIQYVKDHSENNPLLTINWGIMNGERPPDESIIINEETLPPYTRNENSEGKDYWMYVIFFLVIVMIFIFISTLITYNQK